MAVMTHLVVFALDDQRFALPVSAVERVVPAVYVTPLPKSPAIVLGVINVQGRIVPVINLRKRCRIPEREMDLNDQIIIAHTSKRAVALVVDSTQVVACPEEELIPVEQILPGLDYANQVLKRPEGLVLIYSLDTLLSLDDERALGGAISLAPAGQGVP